MMPGYRFPNTPGKPGEPVKPEDTHSLTALTVKSVIAAPADSAKLNPGAQVEKRARAYRSKSHRNRVVATLVKLVRERIPERFGLDPIREIQVLCPMNRGSLGVRELNAALQGVSQQISKHIQPR
jgi:hypothetical protein